MQNNSTGKLVKQNRYINLDTCNSSNGRFVRKVGKVFYHVRFDTRGGFGSRNTHEIF